MNNVSRAIELKSQLDALRPLSVDQEQRIWQKFRFDWNYHSNNIEGNSLTFGETKSLLLHNITAQGKPLKDHIEITGHNEAISALLEVARGGDPLTESFIRNLHTLILRERYQVDAQTPDGKPTKKWIEVGQYKTAPNHVLTLTGEMFRFAEPFEVPVKMRQFVSEVNALNKPSDSAALIAAARFHYELVLIHPFDDGNGRMARLLMNLVLIKFGFPPAIIKTDDKANYFAALRQADGGQIDVFVDYVAGSVANSLEIMIAGARGDDIDEFDLKAKQTILALERLLASKGTHVNAVKSKQAIDSAINGVLQPLAAQIRATLKKFSRLLIELTLTFEDRKATGSGAYSYRHLTSQDAIRTSAESNSLVLRLSLRGIRSVGLFNATKNWDFSITLFEDHYQILCDGLSFRIDLLYDATLTETHQRMLDQGVTTATITWLQETTGIDVSRELGSD